MSLSLIISILTIIPGWLVYNEILSTQNGILLLCFICSVYLFDSTKKIKKLNSKNRNVFINNLKIYIYNTTLILLPLFFVSLILAIPQIQLIIEGLSTGNLIYFARQLANETESSITTLSFIGAISDSAKLIYSIFLFLPSNKIELKVKWHKYLYYIAFFLTFIDILSFGKRSQIIYTILLGILFNIVIKNKLGIKIIKNKSYFIKYAFLALFLVFLVFGVFPSIRNPSLTDALTNYVNDAHQREFSPWIEKHFVDSNNSLLLSFPTLIMGISYLHIGLIKFNYFLQQNIYNYESYGLYNFKWIEKIFTGKNSKYDEITESLGFISFQDGYNPNPWGSSLRDLIIDFNIIGAFIFIILLTIITSYYVNRLNSKNILFIIFLQLFYFMIPHTSIFAKNLLGQTLLLILIINFIIKILPKKKRVFEFKEQDDNLM